MFLLIFGKTFNKILGNWLMNAIFLYHGAKRQILKNNVYVWTGDVWGEVLSSWASG